MKKILNLFLGGFLLLAMGASAQDMNQKGLCQWVGVEGNGHTRTKADKKPVTFQECWGFCSKICDGNSGRCPVKPSSSKGKKALTDRQCHWNGSALDPSPPECGKCP